MDNIFCEIFSLIEKDKINSKEEFDDFISNLTNHPTPVREACAYKLDEFYDDKYLDDNSANIILDSITDINPNISRMVCKVINSNKQLQEALVEKLIEKINKILNDFSYKERIQNNKSHAKNKALFSLYWLLEALFYCYREEFYSDEILKILNATISFSDYTIREKTAQLLTKIKNPPERIIEQIKQDNNFYVNFYTKFL